MKATPNSDFLTVDRAAHLAGLSHWTIRKMLQNKRLTRYKSGHKTLVSRVELLELLELKPLMAAQV